MRKLVLLMLCLGVLLSPLPALALHPLATDDAGTMGMLKFQAELVGEFSWDKDDGVSTRQQQLGLTLTAGLLDSLDLVVDVPLQWQQVKDGGQTLLDNGGLTDMTLALKWRMLELGPVSFAIKPSLTLPSGDHDKGLGNARSAYGATLISSFELKPVAIHANVGYTRQNYTDADRRESREDLISLSLATVLSISKDLQLLAEVGATTNDDNSNSVWPAFMTAGVSYAVIDNLAVSLGARWALNKPEADIALLTGLTFSFP